jgi:DNA-binding transcriptional ArsR family regulator
MAGVLAQMQAQCSARGLLYADELARLVGVWLDAEVVMGASNGSVSGSLVARYGSGDGGAVNGGGVNRDTRDTEPPRVEGIVDTPGPHRRVARAERQRALLGVVSEHGPLTVDAMLGWLGVKSEPTVRTPLKALAEAGFVEEAGPCTETGSRRGRAPMRYRVTDAGRAALGGEGVGDAG